MCFFQNVNDVRRIVGVIVFKLIFRFINAGIAHPKQIWTCLMCVS